MLRMTEIGNFIKSKLRNLYFLLKSLNINCAIKNVLQFQNNIIIYKNVFRLKISMNNVLNMQLVHSIGNVKQKSNHLLLSEPFANSKQCEEIPAIAVL